MRLRVTGCRAPSPSSRAARAFDSGGICGAHFSRRVDETSTRSAQCTDQQLPPRDLKIGIAWRWTWSAGRLLTLDVTGVSYLVLWAGPHRMADRTLRVILAAGAVSSQDLADTQ
eukprot:3018569-Prymnesium_polylepis.1